MQAADKLNFIEPFDGVREDANPTEQKRRGHMETFGVVLQTMLYAHPENIDSIEIFQDSEFITVAEASYRLDMSDKSYLHFLIFVQQTEHGLLSAGLSVIEHLSDDTFNGGYMYSLDCDGVRRSLIAKDSEDADMDEDDRKRHFSAIDLMEQISELEDLEQSEDIEEMMAALAVRSELEVNAEFKRSVAEAGLDDAPPYDDELEELAELIMDAYHYPLREYTI